MPWYFLFGKLKTYHCDLYIGVKGTTLTNGNISLNDNISNYNFIIFYTTTSANNKFETNYFITSITSTEVLKESFNTQGFYVIGDDPGHLSNSVSFKYIDERTLYVSYDGNGIYKIVGYKF